MPAPEEILTGFARVLRRAGLPVTMAATHTFIDAVARLDYSNPRDVYWAGRAVLCTRAAHIPTYDYAFHAWFSTKPLPAAKQVKPAITTGYAAGLDGEEAARVRHLVATGGHADYVTFDPEGNTLTDPEVSELIRLAHRHPTERPRKVLVLPRFDTASPKAWASFRMGTCALFQAAAMNCRFSCTVRSSSRAGSVKTKTVRARAGREPGACPWSWTTPW